MTEFKSLNLAAPISRALSEQGYTTPTPIQTQAIPPALEGRDILGIAQTGTGKTAAFALPILNRLATQPRPLQGKSTRALVLAPTRELASQIAESFRTYGRHLPLTVETVFGGVPVNRHIRKMHRGCDVLVATPGRLIDLLDQRAMVLHHVEVLVLDEADQMMDLGFIHSLRKIVPLLPKGRQTLFFSATMPKAISELADQYLKEPVRVAVTPVATTAERVDQRAIYASKQEKTALLVHALSDPSIDRALVFTRTKHGADRVVRQIAKAGIKSAAIHGNKSQPQRQKALDAFRSGGCRVLIATDIAARGIDVDGVSHVINFEIPNVPEQYVHRIGRTARAGRDGQAISFVAPDEKSYMRDIERLTRQKIQVSPLPEGLAEMAETLKAQSAEEDFHPDDIEREPRPEPGRGGRSNRQGRRNAGGRGQNAGQRRERGERSERGERGERSEGRAERPDRKPRRDGERRAGTEGDRAGMDRMLGDRGPRGGDRQDRRASGEGEGARGPRGDRKPRGEWNGRRGEGRPEHRSEGRGENRSQDRGQDRTERRPEGRSEGEGQKRYAGTSGKGRSGGGRPGGKPGGYAKSGGQNGGKGGFSGKPRRNRGPRHDGAPRGE